MFEFALVTYGVILYFVIAALYQLFIAPAIAAAMLDSMFGGSDTSDDDLDTNPYN